jgi:hypothetical protein
MERLSQKGRRRVGRGADGVQRVDCVVNAAAKTKPWMLWTRIRETRFCGSLAVLYDEAPFAEKRRTASCSRVSQSAGNSGNSLREQARNFEKRLK